MTAPVPPVAKIHDATIDAKRAKLEREIAELYARLPLLVRLAYRVWCRLNRRKWERERQAEWERQWAAVCTVMASICIDIEGSNGR